MTLSTIEAKEITGGLARTSKMPGASYSLPATACKTGSRLCRQKGSVCSGCYARKGRYRFGNVRRALEKRLSSIRNTKWKEAMIRLIEDASKDCKYFRWHDSGDLQGMKHLRDIVDIARALPKVQFWLPTKEAILVEAFKKKDTIPTNLTIRYSEWKVDEMPSTVDLSFHKTWAATHTTCKAFKQSACRITVCPAPQQEGKCGNCRACWKASVKCVSYHKH